MARVHLLSSAVETPSNPWTRRDLRRLVHAANKDRFRVHKLEQEPELADVILFVGSSEPDQKDVRTHHLVKRFPGRCFLFESGDRPLPLMPGIYVCAERTWLPRSRFKAGFYLRVFENDAIQYRASTDRLPLLFSFAGSSANAPVRKRLLAIRHPRSELIDTSRLPRTSRQRDGIRGDADQYGQRYVHLLTDSKFVLCPRGLGTSTWRLFETMKAGRVPVIISDSWVAPEGPDWESFSLRIPESQVANIPRLLQEFEEQAVEKGQRAREAWEGWFSAEVAFHRIVEWCLAINVPTFASIDLGRVLLLPHLMRPYFLRHWILRRAGGLIRSSDRL